MTALEGVTRYALNLATKAILRGELGHGFYPSPAELRQACGRAMEPLYASERRQAAIRDQRNLSREIDDIHARKTPEARAKVRELTEQFHRSIEANAEPPVEFDWGPVHKRFDKQAVSITDRKMRQG